MGSAASWGTVHSPSASRRDISGGGPGGSASGGGGRGTQPEQWRSSRALGSVRRPTTITEGVAASGGGGKRATDAPTVTGDFGGGDADSGGAEQTVPGRSSISSGSIARFSDAMEEAMEEADRLAEEFLSDFAAAGGDSDAGVVSPLNNGSSSGEDLASDGSGGGDGGGGGDPLLAVMRSTDSLEGMALR